MQIRVAELDRSFSSTEPIACTAQVPACGHNEPRADDSARVGKRRSGSQGSRVVDVGRAGSATKESMAEAFDGVGSEDGRRKEWEMVGDGAELNMYGTNDFSGWDCARHVSRTADLSYRVVCRSWLPHTASDQHLPRALRHIHSSTHPLIHSSPPLIWVTVHPSLNSGWGTQRTNLVADQHINDGGLGRGREAHHDLANRMARSRTCLR
ncbi:hypothetical protein BDZ45DRAFT_725356 [Acephala macrosclerotiorum]|nr:hypothetical protein BDZ45DRAFT_725356 [Acephala macrosclerotiorum]